MTRFANWTGYRREEIIGRNSVELGLWEQPKRACFPFWAENASPRLCPRPRVQLSHSPRAGSLRSCSPPKVIQISGVPHILATGLDITERKTGGGRVAGERGPDCARAKRASVWLSRPAPSSSRSSNNRRWENLCSRNDALVNWPRVARGIMLWGRSCARVGHVGKIWARPRRGSGRR